MPAFIRALSVLGTVLCLSFGLSAISVHAQTPPDTNLPTITLTTTPDAVPAQDSASPSAAAPAMTSQTPPKTATHKKTVHHKVVHHKKTHHTSKKHKPVKKSKGDAQVREAQTHLANLEYYKGKVDGLNGPKTKAAIKKFQKDHKLRVTGKLTKETYDAIVEADKERAMSSLPPVAPPPPKMPKVVEAEPMPPEAPPLQGPDFYATHPDFYGHYHQSYENPLLLGPTQTLYSRFAKVDLTEDSSDQEPTKRYKLTLNGLPLILVDGQPSVIGVSRTFALGDEDVMIFTSYKDHDPVCAYSYNLLILTADGTRAREIHNCTRGYQAKVTDGSLFITFPESDDGRPVGNTWRYEKGDLEKL